MKRKVLTLICYMALALSAKTILAQPVAQLTGIISGNRTLSADTLYRVSGAVSVQPNSVLTIPAGTRLEGIFGSFPFIQTVRGDTAGPNPAFVSGRIIANGTAASPIVFTSDRPEGSKGRAQSGGIVLNGTAPVNTGSRVGEGGAANGGGRNPADNSGSLRYVRVEYGGIVLGGGNEINGFTFNSVGSGTVLEYLQAHWIADDGFEWFGGNVNSRYLVSTGNDDDAFDTDNGFIGKGQFWVAVQDCSIANRGYEMDNGIDGQENLRTYLGDLTRPTVYNATIIGSGTAQGGGDANDGASFRRGPQGFYYNHIFANFGFGMRVERAATYDRIRTDSLFIRNSIMFVKGGPATVATPNGASNWFNLIVTGNPAPDTNGVGSRIASWGVRTINPQFTRINYSSPFRFTNGERPLLSLQAGSPALTGAATPPNDGFFTPVTYVGAFGQNQGADWMTGWTNWGGLRTLSTSDNKKTVTSFSLEQNYPNPFNPTTAIRFTLQRADVVSLKVYDVLGREVVTLLNGRREAGLNTVNFNASALSSGVYFYKLEVNGFNESRKMTLVK
jgi:hypothetical protein